jgi:ABC-type multidrug transport system ATPase subunit
VFAGLSCNIAAGVNWVGGDEGSGKTTLLRLLAHALEPDAGVVQWIGSSAAQRSPSDVAYIDPRTAEFDALTVAAYLIGMQKRFAGFDGAIWSELVEAFGLRDHLEKSVYMLSTGSKRKLFLATALASGARLALLDEPFAALDLASVRQVLKILAHWSAVPDKACVVADYLPPDGVELAQTICLDD